MHSQQNNDNDNEQQHNASHVHANVNENAFHEFRGIISSGSNKYYIINELSSTETMKLFSAAKVNINKKNNMEFSPKELHIRYINKQYLNSIFTTFKMSDERIHKYYESLRKNLPRFQAIDKPNFQRVYDFIENEKGLFFVLESFDYTLTDYVSKTRRSLKYSKFPIEIKFRNIITDMLDSLNYLHSKSLYLCSLINPDLIYIKESSQVNSINKQLVILPNPYLAHIFTLQSLQTDEGVFPSYFPPEIYNALTREDELNESNEVGQYLIKALNSIDQSFDMWAIGYMVYEVLYGVPPFEFTSFHNAKKQFFSDEGISYEVYPWKISYHMLKLIAECLQLDPKKRMQTTEFVKLINDIKYKNEDLEMLEKDLKTRAEKENKEKDSVIFNLKDQRQADSYIK